LPLQHSAIREKVIYNELVNLAFIYNEHLKQMWVQGGHGREEDLLRQGTKDRDEDDDNWWRHEK
jgi:hypothetical protein